MAEADPFTRVYTAIADALDVHEPLGFAGFPGKLTRLDENPFKGVRRQTVRRPSPGEKTTGYLELWPTGVSFDATGGNSRTRTMRPQYALALDSESLRVLPINTFLFEIVHALDKKGADLGLPNLVRNWVMFPAGFNSTSPHPENVLLAVGEDVTPSAAWTAVGTIEVEICVPRSQLET